MSKFVDSVFSFLGRRSGKEQAADRPTAGKRTRGGKKAVLKADSFVFLPGEVTSNGTYLWGEVITPRTVGVPLSSYSDDYSVLTPPAGGGEGNSRRKNVRSVLVDGSGKLVGRRLSGSFVAKALKTRQSLDEVEDGSLEAFLREFEPEAEEKEKYHTYDRADAREEDDEKYTYDRLIHLPAGRPGQEKRVQVAEGEIERRGSPRLVLDLREGGRRRAGSDGRSKLAASTEQGTVDWRGLREMVEVAALGGESLAHSRAHTLPKRHRAIAT
jgi:hypothetical protein